MFRSAQLWPCLSLRLPVQRGQPAVDLAEVERLRFGGVILGPVLNRGVAAELHADRVVLAMVTRERPLQRDLVLPAGPEVVGVCDLPGWRHGILYPDRVFVPRPLQVHERVTVPFLPHLE